MMEALFLVAPRTNLLELSAFIEGMRAANRMSGVDLFTWSIATIDGEGATASNGFIIPADKKISTVAGAEHLFVIASYEPPAAVTQEILRVVRKAERSGATLYGINLGSAIFAAAGLLEGRQATTHWEVLSSLAERYNKVRFVDSLFTTDGKIVTCAGVTASIDLILHIIEKNFSRDLAEAVAEEMVYTFIRSGEERQRISRIRQNKNLNREIAKAIALMKQSLSEPISIELIATRTATSTRQLEKKFRSLFGCGPAKYYLDLRLSRARELLLYTSMPVGEISAACGFMSQASFSRAFTRELCSAPSKYRRHFETSLARPHLFHATGDRLK